MKNSADLGGCYSPRPNDKVDNIPRDLLNSMIHSLLFIQNILKLSNEKMSFTFNNFARAYPFISPRHKTFVKLPLNPLQL